jgi:hypothetical protein
MESMINDLLDTIRSADVPHATRQISFELLFTLADEGSEDSMEARQALALLERKAKRSKSTNSRATFGDAVQARQTERQAR